jgi:ElaB/YqjD/DUF883 family membrane-anchored ribosome-binding protein
MSDTNPANAASKVVGDAGETVRSAATHATDVAEEQIEMAKAAVSGAVGDVADRATGAVRAAGSMVSDRVDQAARTAQRIADGVNETIETYPIRTVLIAAGAAALAGFVLGYLVSRRS